ncbi:MAG: hypothetical protein ACE5LV_04205 [Candidatus Aminicenantales bacterium]
MDAWLSPDAARTLTALLRTRPKDLPDGLLIGHSRGPRVYVESVLPTQKGFFPSQSAFFDLSRALEDRVVGFYAFRMTEAKRKKILTPLGFGKLLLEVQRDADDKVHFRAFMIDHEKDFFLSPMTLERLR